MKMKHLALLCDPITHEELELKEAIYQGNEIIGGALVSSTSSYPIINGIPRFVLDQGYSDNFGFQWNRWARVQFEDQNIDRPMEGHTTGMFETITGFTPDTLRGKTVLDMGCGPGRFSDVALTMGASVVAMDYSTAIDAAKSNFVGKDADILFVQGDVLQMPLRSESIDYSFTIGVLHHTPNPAKGVKEGYRVTRGGGADCYTCLWCWGLLHVPNSAILAKCFFKAQTFLRSLPAVDVFLFLRNAWFCAGKNLAATELSATGSFPHCLAA